MFVVIFYSRALALASIFFHSARNKDPNGPRMSDVVAFIEESFEHLPKQIEEIKDMNEQKLAVRDMGTLFTAAAVCFRKQNIVRRCISVGGRHVFTITDCSAGRPRGSVHRGARIWLQILSLVANPTTGPDWTVSPPWFYVCL